MAEVVKDRTTELHLYINIMYIDEMYEFILPIWFSFLPSRK